MLAFSQAGALMPDVVRPRSIGSASCSGHGSSTIFSARVLRELSIAL